MAHSKRTGPRGAERGFTLIELLTAIAIFSILVVMLFQMVKSALDVWALGERGKDATEKSAAVLDEIATDLRMLRADSPLGSTNAPVRMISDYAEYDFDLDRTPDSVVQRLRFVRALPEERTDPRLRVAGDEVGAKSGFTEGTETASPTLPPCGLAEVFYSTLKTPEKGVDPARLTLVRGMRSPIGRAGSFLAVELPDDVRALQRDTIRLADGVLYLGFQFWSRDTSDWNAKENDEGGPLTTWDSTRALLLDKQGHDKFLLAKDAASLANADDDVFPRRVRVTLVVERDEDEAAMMVLEQDLSASTQRVKLSPLRLLEPLATYKYFKIGGEWFEWIEIRGDEVVVKRGVRDTLPDNHAAGSRVHIGTTFERTIEIPVYREDWNTR